MKVPHAPPGFASMYASVVAPTHAPEGIFQQVTEGYEARMSLTTMQSQYEAKANAERRRAVDLIVNKEKYAAWEAAKAEGGAKKEAKGDKKGGKKKK